MLIFPAIDLIDGQCVRLRQGDYAQKTVYHDDPLSVVRDFVNQGAEWLHLVDLDGAKAGKPTAKSLAVVRRIYDEGLPIKVEFGGGVRSELDIAMVMASGATRVILGSVLAKDKGFAREVFKLGDAVVAGIDTKDGRVAVHGWQETSDDDGIAFARLMVENGCRRIIWTDIATDGMLQGPNVAGLREMVDATAVAVIASGGVSSLEDLRTLRREVPELEGVIVGKAIYEGRLTVAESVAALADTP